MSRTKEELMAKVELAEWVIDNYESIQQCIEMAARRNRDRSNEVFREDGDVASPVSSILLESARARDLMGERLRELYRAVPDKEED